MRAELPARIFLGNEEPRRQRKFTISSAGALLLLSLLVSNVLSANWWESAGLPLVIGIMLLIGAVGGTREYGILYVLIPAYVFSIPIFEGAYLMNTTGPEPVIRKILGVVLLPLLITVTLVGAGYVIGTGIHLFRIR